MFSVDLMLKGYVERNMGVKILYQNNI